MREHFAPPSARYIDQSAKDLAQTFHGKTPEAEVLGRASSAAVSLAVERQYCYPLVQDGEQFYVFANQRG